MKKIKIFFMVLLAIAMPIVFSSCEANDSSDEYFIVLDGVSSNIVNSETGESLADQLYESFEYDNGGNSISLGKYDLAPVDTFDEFCMNFQTLLQEGFYENLPEEGWITYTFTLRKGSPEGEVQMTKHIHI